MKILVLGGSIFIGYHFVVAAVASGYKVSVFNRGRQSVAYPPGVE